MNTLMHGWRVCQNSGIREEGWFEGQVGLTESTWVSKRFVADIAYERLLIAVDKHVLS